MEESLKARLIGAAVLVALAVLLIPELLSGRKETPAAADEAAGPRGTRTFTIELGQAPGQASRSPTTSSAPPPSASAPTANAAPEGMQPGGEAVAEAPVAPGAGGPAVEAEREAPPVQQQVASPATDEGPTVEAARPASGPVRPAEPPVASVPGGWAVQVGAFGSVDTARKLASDLNAAGYRAFVSPTQRGGKTLYRVRVGPEGERAGAERLVPRLKSRGLPATIVQND
jgi:DedD protein